MKITLFAALTTMSTLSLAQNIEVEGKAKITVMDTVPEEAILIMGLREYTIKSSPTE